LWGALLQIAAVVGLAEMAGGRFVTLFIASVGQLLSTLVGRLLIALGTAVVIGLPLSQAGVLDTGPSGVSTAVGGWLLARRGAYVSLTLLMGAILLGAVLQANLDGREHAAALLVGVGAALIQGLPLHAMSRRVVSALRWVRSGIVAGGTLVRQLARCTQPVDR
jgi:hypothetical protein